MKFENCTPEELVGHLEDFLNCYLQVKDKQNIYERACKALELNENEMLAFDSNRINDDLAEKKWEKLKKKNTRLTQERNKAEYEYLKFDFDALKQKYANLFPVKYWKDIIIVYDIIYLLQKSKAKTVEQALNILDNKKNKPRRK